MTLRWIVMGVAALLVLAYIWFGNYRRTRREREVEPGRGVADEAARAFEDVADQIIASSAHMHRPVAKPPAAGPRSKTNDARAHEA